MTWWRRERAGEGKELLGREDEGAVEWEKPLESSEALKGRRCEKSSRFNARRWTVQTRGASMGHVTDASRATPHDVSRNHYGDRKVQAMGRYAAAFRPVAAWVQNSKWFKFRGAAAEQPRAGLVLEPVRPETAGRALPGLTSRTMTSEPDERSWDFDGCESTSARNRTRRSPMLTHETSPVSRASVVGMTIWVGQEQSHLSADAQESPRC
jgi:hypothetical protein